jgi:hypothetical protein
MQREARCRTLAATMTLLSLTFTLVAFAQQDVAPELINYQGRLVDDGNLVNGQKRIVFRIYDAAVSNDFGMGSMPMYAQTDMVSVVDGLFATEIGGATNDTGSGLFDVLATEGMGSNYWLELEVDGVTLEPRERLSSVPYALAARTVVDGAIGWSQLAEGAVSGNRIQAGSIDSGHIDNRSIRLEDIWWNHAEDGDVIKWNGSNWIVAPDLTETGVGGGGVTNHGELSGLGGDDHPHYLLADGTRALTGNLSAGGNKVTGLAAATAAGDAMPLGQAAGGDLGGSYPNPTIDAYSDLSSAGRLDNNNGSDLLTRAQADERFGGGGGGSAHANLAAEGYLGNEAGDIAQNNGVLQANLNADALDGKHAAGFLGTVGSQVYNDSGLSTDFRFEGNTDQNLLLLDGSADAVGVGVASPQGKFQIGGGEVRIGSSGTPGVATGDGDLYVGDVLEVDGGLRVDGGNVGIGTSSPRGALQVAGDEVRIGSGGTPAFATRDGCLYVEDVLEVDTSAIVHGDVGIGDGPSGQDGSGHLRISGGRETWYVGVQNEATVEASDFFIGQSETEDGIFHIENGGRVGIGTTAPEGKLHIAGGEVRIGSGSPDVATNSGDLYVSSDIEVDGFIHIDSVHGPFDEDQIRFGRLPARGIMTWYPDTESFYFSDDVDVDGTLTKNAGSFKIEHPLDPANKYLYHSFVESPDMMNVYNGNVVLDDGGEAEVTLPDWFEALNRDFRYQLTAIGAPGPNLHIARKITGNCFAIAGGTEGMEVSWQVTGIRQDAYANAHRIPIEEDKPDDEKGTYRHPELHGQPASKRVGYEGHQ